MLCSPPPSSTKLSTAILQNLLSGLSAAARAQSTACSVGWGRIRVGWGRGGWGDVRRDAASYFPDFFFFLELCISYKKKLFIILYWPDLKAPVISEEVKAFPDRSVAAPSGKLVGGSACRRMQKAVQQQQTRSFSIETHSFSR